MRITTEKLIPLLEEQEFPIEYLGDIRALAPTHEILLDDDGNILALTIFMAENQTVH